MIFEIFRDSADSRSRAKWRWRLLADSSETVAYGKGYRSKADAERAVSMVRHACADPACLIISEKMPSMKMGLGR